MLSSVVSLSSSLAHGLAILMFLPLTAEPTEAGAGNTDNRYQANGLQHNRRNLRCPKTHKSLPPINLQFVRGHGIIFSPSALLGLRGRGLHHIVCQDGVVLFCAHRAVELIIFLGVPMEIALTILTLAIPTHLSADRASGHLIHIIHLLMVVVEVYPQI